MSLLSAATIANVGLICKFFLHSGLCSMRVNGLEVLKSILEDSDRRAAGQGVVTVCNHISTLDDPLSWGVLPARYYFHSHTTRWALGASDIIFTNPVFSTFFKLGQTLETFRGKGIYQASVDEAIKKLNMGHWVHLFGEGRVVQPHSYPKDSNGCAHLIKFKWGIGRILMEAKIPPVVIPMWITGFDELMPEGRPFPYNYIPRKGARLTVSFGQPICAEEIRQSLDVSKHYIGIDSTTIASGEHLIGWLGREAKQKHREGSAEPFDEGAYIALIRQRVTAIIQRDVEALGRSISGDLLWSKG